MKNEQLVQDIKGFLNPFGLWNIESIEEIVETNVILINADSKLWDLVNNKCCKINFGDLPRDIKDIVMNEHPEIGAEFDEAYENMDEYPERYDFPMRIEFDSNEEYERLKEQYLYEEMEQFLKDYYLIVDIGPIVYERLESIVDKYDMFLTFDFGYKKGDKKYENMVIIDCW